MSLRAFVLCLALGSSVLAQAKQKPLPMPLAEQLPVEIVLSQQEMGVEVPDNSAVAAQFGLIGALIGAAIQTTQVANAEKRIVDIRNLMIDYRFNDKMEAALRAKLATPGISPDPQITVMPTPWDAAKAVQANEQPRQGVMVIVPRYVMYNNFELMRINLTVMIVDRTLKSNGKLKEKIRVYKNYVYNFPMTRIAGSGAEEDAARWEALGKDGLAALLDTGIEQVTDIVAYDFSEQGRADALVKLAKEKVSIAGFDYNGRKVRGTDEYVWVRSGPMRYSSITGYHPVTIAAATATTADTAAPAADVAATATPAVEATAVDANAVVDAPVAEAPVAATPAVEAPAAEAAVAATPAVEAPAAVTPADASMPVEAAPEAPAEADAAVEAGE
jgi:hypothetical protein